MIETKRFTCRHRHRSDRGGDIGPCTDSVTSMLVKDRGPSAIAAVGAEAL